MAPDMTPNARPYSADAVTDSDLARDLEHLAQANADRAAVQRGAQDLAAAQTHFTALVTQYDDHISRLAGLEDAARAAIDAVATDAGNRLSQTVDRAETRVMEALAVLDQQQRDAARWRDDLDERLRAQMRDLGEWDDTLTEMRHEVGGLREMAEASVALASGDLDHRWDALRRELRDILATAESDERARWEAFMAGAAETLANHSGIDPAELAAVRADLATLRDAATTTIQQMQQAQREQLAALRTELHALVESERAHIAAGVEQRLEDARAIFLTQTRALDDWQQQVGRDVAALKATAVAAETGVRDARATLRAEVQGALTALRTELDQGVAQARVTAQAEVSALRADTERMVRRTQSQTLGRQSLSLLVAILALLVALGALALPFVLHLH
jgi:hypothetical protein